jgi:hypothetical protein
VLRHVSWPLGFVRVALAALVMLITGCGRLGYTLLEQHGSPADSPFDDDGDGDSEGDGDADGDGDMAGGDAGLHAGDGDGDGDAAGDAGADAARLEPAERTFGEACDFDALAVIQNGDLLDNASGAILHTAMITRCLNLGSTRTVSQDDPGILDPGTGRLLLGPEELALVAGGPETQRALTYLDERRLAPIVRNDAGKQTYELAESATGRVVLSVPANTITLGHEYAVVMVCHEPVSDTTMISVYGYEGMGTTAGARWLAEAVLDDGKHWYVVEWTDSNGNAEPGPGDTFSVVDSG